MSHYDCIHGVSFGVPCPECDAKSRQRELEKKHLADAASAELKRKKDLRTTLVSDLLAYRAKKQDQEAEELRNRLLAGAL